MERETPLGPVRAFLAAPLSSVRDGSPLRDRRALLALAPLALFFLAVLAWAPWRSHFDIDTETRFLQILAIADHGTAGFDNGPVAGNPELTPSWLFPAHGLAWGPYPVLGDYLLAPAVWLDGFRGVIRALWLLFAEACFVTYALTYRLTRRPAIAVLAAYALGVSTSLGFWGTMIAPFLATAAYGVTSLYLVSASLDAPSRRDALARAAAAGLFASLAVGSHMLWVLAWAAVPLACALGFGGRAGAERAAAYLLASAPGLAVMGAVNHVRFGTWSPFSYGPCLSEGCLDPVAAAKNPQNGGAFVALALPLVPYVLVAIAAIYCVRRSRAHLAALVFVATLAALVPDAPSGTFFRNAARTLWAYVVDMGSLDTGYPKWSDDPGTFSSLWRYGSPFAVRALLQCSPFLAAALLPFAPSEPRARRVTRWALAAACAGLMASLLMRSNFPGPQAIGVPFLNERYLVPIVPALTVLAFVAVSELPLRVWHVVVALVVAGTGAAALSVATSDDDLARRQVTHWAPLGLALVLWVSASGARLLAGAARRAVAARVAALTLALSLGYGGAIVFGVDRVAAKVVRGFQDGRAEELARCTPERFVLMGARAMVESMAIMDEKEIRFVNPLLGPRDGKNARRLIAEAASRDRPAFIVDEDTGAGQWQLSWPGWRALPIEGCPRVRRLVPPAAGAP